jgi:hypothetical protein
MVMTLAYVGSEGHRLITNVESNPGDPNLCLSLRGSGVRAGTAQCGPNGENGTYTRPDGSQVFGTRGPFGNNFTSNSYQMNTANSNYNSFQATLERKAADLTFVAAYTFSKSMDNSSAFGGKTNFSNYRLSRALSSFDVTHNFVFSYNYAIPLGRSLHGIPRRLAYGWSIAGINRFASGFPVVISQSGDRSLVGSTGTDVPNYVGPLVTYDPRKLSAAGQHLFFAKEGFVSGPLGGFGSSNPKFFHGPGFNNWDVSLHKDTRITERMALQFRAEFFNVMNHAQFNNPTGNFNSSLFGAVTSARDPRIGQMSLKFLW